MFLSHIGVSLSLSPLPLSHNQLTYFIKIKKYGGTCCEQAEELSRETEMPLAGAGDPTKGRAGSDVGTNLTMTCLQQHSQSDCKGEVNKRNPDSS